LWFPIQFREGCTVHFWFEAKENEIGEKIPKRKNMFASLVVALKRTMKNNRYVFLSVYLNNSEKYVAQQRYLLFETFKNKDCPKLF
jgi:fatty acid-binding protein DegV